MSLLSDGEGCTVSGRRAYCVNFVCRRNFEFCIVLEVNTSSLDHLSSTLKPSHLRKLRLQYTVSFVSSVKYDLWWILTWYPSKWERISSQNCTSALISQLIFSFSVSYTEKNTILENRGFQLSKWNYSYQVDPFSFGNKRFNYQRYCNQGLNWFQGFM